MINRIETYNTNISYRGSTQKESKKKIFNDKSSTIITSLATVSSVAIGVLLASKHIQAKRMQDVGRRIIQKPEIFTEKTINEIAKDWLDEGKIDFGDKVAILPKSVLQSIAKDDKNYANILKGMKMSDNAFGVTIMRADNNIDFEALRYYDPQKITILKMVDTIKNDKIYYCEIG